jgi:hypothetical protein
MDLAARRAQRILTIGVWRYASFRAIKSKTFENAFQRIPNTQTRPSRGRQVKVGSNPGQLRSWQCTGHYDQTTPDPHYHSRQPMIGIFTCATARNDYRTVAPLSAARFGRAIIMYRKPSS